MNRTVTKSPVYYIIIWNITVRLELITLAGWLHQGNTGLFEMIVGVLTTCHTQ